MVLWVAARAWGPVGQILDVPLPLPPTVRGRVVEPVRSLPAPLASRPAAPAPANVVTGPTAILPVPPEPVPFVAVPPVSVPKPAPQPAHADWLTPPAPPPPQDAPRVIPPPATPFSAVPPEARGKRRWSADAWFLLRDKARSGAALVGSGTYGASQAGAVLRYRLAPNSGFDPAAYLRVTTTVGGEDEKEAALGLSLRPIRTLPVNLMVEGRVLRFNGDRRLRPSETRVRPAVMAVIGPPPVDLALDFRAEVYAQGGYIGGKGATAFADGQLRAVRTVPAFADDRLSLDAGIGVWGGAQKDAERIDVGPSAALRFPVSKGVFGRASLDWRQRVGGKAEPGSGPVLTVSAGF